MDLYNLILTAKIQKGGGGGGDVEVDALNVTENGTYSASSGHAYNPVSVNVPGIVPSGTSEITSNGIYDVSNYASASVNVPQPTGTSVITSNGLYNVTNFSQASVSVPTGITPTGTSSITANGIYDITSFASVDVNVSGGGGITADDIAMRAISGVVSGSAIEIRTYAFTDCFSLTGFSFPNATAINSSAFYRCIKLEVANCPNVKMIQTDAFRSCTSLSLVSAPICSYIGQATFRSCSKLMAVYLLSTSVVSLGNSAAFSNTPMTASSYTGAWGSIYVPASLVSNYKTATNWNYFADRITSYVE